MKKTVCCGGKSLRVDRPSVMGILNVTPDSFSDGGRYSSVDQAVRRAGAMVEEGAHIIDVGGESTRPGAAAVSVQEELDRVVPVLEALCAEYDTIVSIDTSEPQVMREAAAIGAGIINDVRALTRPGALQAAAESGLAVVLMHSGTGSLADTPQACVDVTDAVAGYLAERVSRCVEAGIARGQIFLDPGFGGGMFGKTTSHNLQLVRDLAKLCELDLPLLVGVSRKAFIGDVLGRALEQRLAGGLALALVMAQAGAKIVRTHDVGATVDALSMARAVDAL